MKILKTIENLEYSNEIQDAVNYFNLRLEDLKEDDVHYLNCLVEHINNFKKQLKTSERRIYTLEKLIEKS